MDPRWQRAYWQGTALLLAAHLAGWTAALPLAVLLNVLQINHRVVLRRRLGAFDVQVGVAHVVGLALGSVGPLWPLHVVQLISLNVLLVTDYCLLARLLVLLPGNRPTPLSWRLLRRALLSPPVAGVPPHAPG
jgi:hypothetical protein